MKDISVAYISYGKQVEQTGSYFRQDLYLENLESFWVRGFRKTISSLFNIPSVTMNIKVFLLFSSTKNDFGV